MATMVCGSARELRAHYTLYGELSLARRQSGRALPEVTAAVRGRGNERLIYRA
jgi:hypothetical protein